MNKWLLFDCSYLCYRAFHTTGHLSFGDIKTGVIYGFFQSIKTLQELHETNRIAFCFDSKASKRRELYPAYKQARRDKYKDMDEEEAQLWDELRKQMRLLRTKYLPALGFKNIFVQRGYEADDIIASLIENTFGIKHQSIIISSDHDLYQLLASNVMMWDPNKGKMMTKEKFKEVYEVDPQRWCEVKAFAGCSSDGVEGIAGIGEKTAAKWITGKVPQHHKAHQRMLDGVDIYNRNMPLVRLPFDGVKSFEVQDDEVTSKKWNKVLSKLGMTSMRTRSAFLADKRRKRKTKKRSGGFFDDR